MRVFFHQKATPVPPSSSKFNPKDSEKTSKRHQLSMTFPCVFRFLSSETKKHKEKSSKGDVFSMSFQSLLD